jgi:hypothetical protein
VELLIILGFVLAAVAFWPRFVDDGRDEVRSMVWSHSYTPTDQGATTHLHRSLPGRQHVCRGSNLLDGGVRRCGDKRSLAASVKGRRLGAAYPFHGVMCPRRGFDLQYTMSSGQRIHAKV